MGMRGSGGAAASAFNVLFVLLFLASVLAFSAAAQDYMVYQYLTGGEPNGWKSFNQPADVWVDESTARIFVADPYQYAVQVFGTNLTHLTIIGTGAVTGSLEPRGLAHPEAITMSGDHIYVADAGFPGVKIFTKTYSEVGNIPTAASSFDFAIPSGVAVDAKNNTYISDTGNNRVQVYDALLGYKDSIGTSGSLGDDVLNMPRGIFVKDNMLYIADSKNNRVKIIYTNGTFVKTIGIGSGGVSLYEPNDVFVGIDNRIYVADTLNDRIVVFSPGGNPISVIGGNLSGKILSKPRGVYVDSLDYVYIADTGNNRVLIMKPLSALPSIALNASAEIDAAGVEIVAFNALLASTASFVNYTAGDKGASSYLELARQHYDGKDYATAAETARLARSFIAEAYSLLENTINTTTRTRVSVIIARLDFYDQNITAGRLDLNTTNLRQQAQAVIDDLNTQQYPRAVSAYNALKTAADTLEDDINAELEGAKKGRAELMRSLDSLMGNVSVLKERASVYKQELNTSKLDAYVSQSTFALTKDLFAATKAYESALTEYQELKITLDDEVRAVVDANASIVYAETQVAADEKVSGIVGKPDMTQPRTLLEEAKRIIYSNPALAKELAAQAVAQADSQKEAIQKGDEALKQGIVVMLAIVLVAISVVYYVYRMRLKQSASPPRVERHYQPPAAPPAVPPSHPSAPPAQQPAIPYSPPRQPQQLQPQPKAKPGPAQPKRK